MSGISRNVSKSFLLSGKALIIASNKGGNPASMCVTKFFFVASLSKLSTEMKDSQKEIDRKIMTTVIVVGISDIRNFGPI